MDDKTITHHQLVSGIPPQPPPSFSGHDLSGTTLGSYQLVRKLAEGGMGVVYEAIQTSLDRRVALKVLNEALNARPEFLLRFEREAKSAANLNHPNIVHVHDFGHANGRHYLVMELVEGEDLSSLIARRGKLPLTEALDFIKQAAQGLKAAADKATIHRDVKPSNLLLTIDGRLKVSDLGLAKILTEDSDVTGTGFGMGSPYFMAPEQADDSSAVDHRADIYALGITLLFLLTGKKPFGGTSPLAIVLGHVNKPLPRGEELGTQLPEPVEALIQRMCAKKPDDRYATYDELLADIERVANGYTPKINPHSTAASLAEAFARPNVIKSTNRISSAVIVGLTSGIFVFVAIALLRNWLFSPPNTVSQSIQTNVVANDLPERRPPPFEEGFDGPERRGMPPLLRPLRPIISPLQDAPVPQMLAAADAYASANTNNFREILARYQQISLKSPGTPENPRVQQALADWTAKRDAAALAAFNTLAKEVDAMMDEHGHRAAMEHIRTFPDHLRTDAMDRRILEEIRRPPPGGPGGPSGPRPGPDRFGEPPP